MEEQPNYEEKLTSQQAEPPSSPDATTGEPPAASGATSADEDTGKEMTPAELAEAREYGRLQLRCDLIDRAVDLVYLALMAFLFAKPLDAFLSRSTWLAQYDTLRLAALAIVVLLLHYAVSFPLSFYSGFRLEHRFSLSNLSFPGWIGRYAKRIGLTVAFSVVMFVGLYWIIWTTGAAWWLIASAAFFVVGVVLSQIVPVVIVPLFYNVQRIEDDELENRMTRLTQGTNLSIEGVYRLDLSVETKKANAMLAGLGRTRRVLMGDTVLEQFTPDEIEVIFAHEIGHHVHRHIHKMIVAGAVTSLVGFWLCDRLLTIAAGGAEYAQTPTSTLPLLMFALTLFSMLLEPLQNAISRRYERQCDTYALRQTGAHAAYRSAFSKLARLNKDDPDPHPLEVLLFHSHPPISKRLALADTVK